jgi:hypothetical protein
MTSLETRRDGTLRPLLMKGNEAMAEAAIQAGCDAYFGYPITPQAELLEWMARRMPKLGRVFVQAESELGAINMGLGATAGWRASSRWAVSWRDGPSSRQNQCVKRLAAFWARSTAICSRRTSLRWRAACRPPLD